MMCYRVAKILIAAGLLLFLSGNAFASVIYRDYLIKKYRGIEILCEPYIVRPSDSLYRIFRKKGEIASRRFGYFLSIFRKINPHVNDVNRIEAGQLIFIPLKRLTKDSFANQASGVVTIPYVTLSDAVTARVTPYVVKRGDSVSRLLLERFGKLDKISFNRAMMLFRLANPRIIDLNHIFVGQRILLPDPGLLKGQIRVSASTKRKKPVLAILKKIAPGLGVRVEDRGVYFFPGPERNRIDLGRTPVLFKGGRPFILYADLLDKAGYRAVKHWWPDAVMIPSGSVDEGKILAKLFPSGDPQGSKTSFVLDEKNVRIRISASVVVKSKEGEKICISFLQPGEPPTPEPLVDYLKERGIRMVEVSGKKTETMLQAEEMVKNRTIPSGNRLKWISEISDYLGFDPITIANISIPCSEITISISSPVLIKEGRISLLDFGNLYGECIKELKGLGFDFLRFDPHITLYDSIKGFLDHFKVSYEEDLSFKAAKRSSGLNTFVRIPGLLIQNGRMPPVFLPETDIDPRLEKLLNSKGISVWTSS